MLARAPHTRPWRCEAIVPAELWERVQEVMDGCNARGAKKGRRDFACSGLIACHARGCAVVGEIKKERYVYYHCTGYADKCQGNPASCRSKYVREEALKAQFTELLDRLRFDDEVLEWVRDALHSSHADERREHEEAIFSGLVSEAFFGEASCDRVGASPRRKPPAQPCKSCARLALRRLQNWNPMPLSAI